MSGPPTHIAVALFASAWGVKLTRESSAEPIEHLPATGPAIADLMGDLAVAPGGDTADASAAILAKLAAMRAGADPEAA